jgi:signal transduction histidine kinase
MPGESIAIEGQNAILIRANPETFAEISKRIAANIEASLFRIIIELINNTLKHSSANNAFIDIILIKNNLVLHYSDDGIGFDLKPVLEKSAGQGLINIINRTKSIGGEIAIDTKVNQGFNVTISIQIKQLDQAI